MRAVVLPLLLLILLLGSPVPPCRGEDDGTATQAITVDDLQMVLDLKEGEVRGTVRTLAVCPNDPALAALMVTQVGERVIWILNMDSGETQRVASASNAEEDLLGTQKAKDDELDWCPVKDARGRSWFAFVGKGDGGDTGVYLGYSGGTRTYRAIEGPSWAGWPRWSPDGDHIAFHGTSEGAQGGRIFVADGLSGWMSKDDPSDMMPVKPRQVAEMESYYPDWSPDGKYVAFSGEVGGLGEGGGVAAPTTYENWAILVVDALKPQKQPANLTLTMTETDEWRPTWSPDGDYIAFHLTREMRERGTESDRLEAPGTAKNTEVKIVRVVEGGCKVSKGILQEGTFDLEKNLVVDAARGPVWGPEGSYLLFYIPIRGLGDKGLDPIRQPIRYARIMRWAKTEELRAYDFAVPTGLEYQSVVALSKSGDEMVTAVAEGIKSKVYRGRLSGEDLLPMAKQTIAVADYQPLFGRWIESPCRTCWRDPRCASCWYKGVCGPIGLAGIAAGVLSGGGGKTEQKDLIGSPPGLPTTPTRLLMKR